MVAQLKAHVQGKMEQLIIIGKRMGFTPEAITDMTAHLQSELEAYEKLPQDMTLEDAMRVSFGK